MEYKQTKQGRYGFRLTYCYHDDTELGLILTLTASRHVVLKLKEVSTLWPTVHKCGFYIEM